MSRPISSIHIDIADFLSDLMENASTMEERGKWVTDFAFALAKRDRSRHPLAAKYLAEAEDYRESERIRKGGKGRNPVESVESGGKRIFTPERQPTDRQSRQTEQTETPSLVARAALCLELYPTSRERNTGESERVLISQKAKEDLNHFIEKYPDYPIEFAIQHFANGTKRPKDLANFLLALPAIETLQPLMKKFLKSSMVQKIVPHEPPANPDDVRTMVADVLKKLGASR